MDILARKNIRALLFLMRKNNYKVYTKPYQLNIVGVRANSTVPNKFDDRLYVFWKNDKNKWEGKSYPFTTDPGTYWLKNPMHEQGTAILKQGQYEDVYKIDMHRNTYLALCQRGGKVTVIRDYDRNAILDFNNGKEMTGMFGINIHRANKKGNTKEIGKNSAGCQVFQDADDFAEFMTLAQRHKLLHGNSFTYTLFDERAYTRSLKRRGVYAIAGAALILAAWSLIRVASNKPIIPR
jgi:hypothetical protein